ncbi:MLX-interacting protein isoform X2 [Conger conger]|uniref:MLX-interacting protein isoform X2 n=1 Tax=Conger conger TaxID=82655 RepID=UPI002A5A5181|nr:MLX-interacting protein isoform X2 [Conger conger]
MATRELRQYRRAAMNIKQEQDDDSDNEEPNLVLKKSDGDGSQVIHSGHFMVSSPHFEHPPKKGYDFDTVNKQTCQTYHFGKTSTSQFSIDASLTKLFECMTLAYSGKLVSPKWKNFKGLKLLWRDKIRLNNAIWRAWYMQYVEKRENPVCHFVTPLEGSIVSEDHRQAEAIATEGNYWKRRIEIVIREYHKWRTYFKKRLQKHKDEDLSSLLKGAEEQLSLFGEVFPDTLRVSLCQDEEVGAGGGAGRRGGRKSRESPVPMEMDPLFDMDVLMSEFSDTLFSTLASHQPIAWPNPREIAHAGNADMIQPGLIPLQPNLDFMDTFEPLQDLFHTLRQPAYSSASPSPSTSTVPPSPSNSSQTQTSMLLPTLSAGTTPVSLEHRLIGSPASMAPAIANHSSGSSAVLGYSQHYVPQFHGALLPLSSTANVNMTVSAHPEAPPPGPGPGPGPTLAPTPLPLQGQVSTETTPSSVITHTASPTIPPSEAATTFSHSSGFSLPRMPCRTAPQPQPAPPTPATVQTFALPKPVPPPSTSKKTRPVQRIVPATPITSQHLILAAPFPGHPNAVLVSPSPLNADVIPQTSVVITSSIGRAPGFHILPQAHKSAQLIVPKEETASSSNGSKQIPSTSTVRDGCCSGQGSPCPPDQAPSPQSPLNRNESNQSRRVNHISAEQKRRFNINIGFKTLCGLVPTLKSQSNLKPISSAATLQKTVEYIGKLQQDRLSTQEEARRLRQEIEELNASISSTQMILHPKSVPVTPPVPACGC